MNDSPEFMIDIRRVQRVDPELQGGYGSMDPQIAVMKELKLRAKIRRLAILQKVTGHNCENISATAADQILNLPRRENMSLVFVALIATVTGAVLSKASDILLTYLRKDAKAIGPDGRILRSSLIPAFLTISLLACLATSITLIWHWFTGQTLVYCATLPLAGWIIVAPILGFIVSAREAKRLKSGRKTPIT